ncbi:glutaredoxin 3 [Phaeovulum vinaykumarii]|uniref:Glutaredoxin n=1 Tax=Phaeovulum vinaykumarii TaxID=407234 RepID=A0A1N7KBP8_9RHOB|nr:glutaredoxin 3 [Phaeovulum vinaykumarii]SIS59011.1 glutaredoxin 3 [Phaeovulum vinaykumarii]SOB93986.1 glutaredoxin 3 [Phaeovulum vinaykumarii]
MPQIEIYTTPTCPYCIAAKRLLDAKGASYTEIDVTDPADRAQMRARAGRNSVPQIWIGARHVGGCDELHALEYAGDLDPLLKG